MSDACFHLQPVSTDYFCQIDCLPSECENPNVPSMPDDVKQQLCSPKLFLESRYETHVIVHLVNFLRMGIRSTSDGFDECDEIKEGSILVLVHKISKKRT